MQRHYLIPHLYSRMSEMLITPPFGINLLLQNIHATNINLMAREITYFQPLKSPFFVLPIYYRLVRKEKYCFYTVTMNKKPHTTVHKNIFFLQYSQS